MRAKARIGRKEAHRTRRLHRMIMKVRRKHPHMPLEEKLELAELMRFFSTILVPDTRYTGTIGGRPRTNPYLRHEVARPASHFQGIPLVYDPNFLTPLDRD